MSSTPARPTLSMPPASVHSTNAAPAATPATPRTPSAVLVSPKILDAARASFAASPAPPSSPTPAPSAAPEVGPPRLASVPVPEPATAAGSLHPSRMATPTAYYCFSCDREHPRPPVEHADPATGRLLRRLCGQCRSPAIEVIESRTQADAARGFLQPSSSAAAAAAVVPPAASRVGSRSQPSPAAPAVNAAAAPAPNQQQRPPQHQTVLRLVRRNADGSTSVEVIPIRPSPQGDAAAEPQPQQAMPFSPLLGGPALAAMMGGASSGAARRSGGSTAAFAAGASPFHPMMTSAATSAAATAPSAPAAPQIRFIPIHHANPFAMGAPHQQQGGGGGADADEDADGFETLLGRLFQHAQQESQQSSGRPARASDVLRLKRFTVPQRSEEDSDAAPSAGQQDDASSASCCTVCMDSPVAGDDCVELPCGHVFHAACIGPWFDTHDTCPSCRRPVALDTDAEQQKPPQPSAEEAQ